MIRYCLLPTMLCKNGYNLLIVYQQHIVKTVNEHEKNMLTMITSLMGI